MWTIVLQTIGIILPVHYPLTNGLECLWDMTGIILFHASQTDDPVKEGLLRLEGVFEFSVWIIQNDTGREKRILEEYQTKSVLEDGRKYGISIWLVDAVYFQMYTVWIYKGKSNWSPFICFSLLYVFKSSLNVNITQSHWLTRASLRWWISPHLSTCLTGRVCGEIILGVFLSIWIFLRAWLKFIHGVKCLCRLRILRDCWND